MLTGSMNLKIPKQDLAGFTLIELIITIAILALLMAFGIPTYMDMVRNTQIRNAAESMHAGIQLARIEALRRNTNTSFWLVSLADLRIMNNTCALSSVSSSWVVSSDDPTSQCGSSPSNITAPRIVQTHAAGDGNLNVAVTVQPGGSNQVTFNGLGQVVATGAPLTRIDIASSQNAANFRSLRIIISASGSTRVCDPAITAVDDPRRC